MSCKIHVVALHVARVVLRISVDVNSRRNSAFPHLILMQLHLILVLAFTVSTAVFASGVFAIRLGIPIETL